MSIDYPQQKQLCDAEQFIEIFKQICSDKVISIESNKLGVVTIYFKDGSHCGGLRIWKEAGFDVY